MHHCRSSALSWLFLLMGLRVDCRRCWAEAEILELVFHTSVQLPLLGRQFGIGGADIPLDALVVEDAARHVQEDVLGHVAYLLVILFHVDAVLLAQEPLGEADDVVEGETAASVLLRFLQERGYEPDYQGSATMNFYLRRISRGDIAYRANVPEHLWELILRDGITTNDNYDRDSIGEFDYTQGSGWMYSINGTLYEGTGMSGYKVRNGITIYVRFTLSYGKDIGGYDSTGGGYGSLSSYCGLWINGGYQALGHDFVETDRLEPTETEDGYIHYRCSKCHEEKTDILPATGGTEPSPTAAQAAPALLLRRGSGLTPYQNKFHRTWEAAA